MTYTIIDPNDLLKEGIFSEDSFLDAVEKYDWNQFRDKKVLIRGCSSNIIPPWAFMKLTAVLVNIVHSIRFGNEHDNIVLFRRKK